MDSKISTQNELYLKLKPALRTKKHELFLNGIKYVKEIDIWNYNKEVNWRNARGLTLASMVDNILNTNSIDILGIKYNIFPFISFDIHKRYPPGWCRVI